MSAKLIYKELHLSLRACKGEKMQNGVKKLTKPRKKKTFKHKSDFASLLIYFHLLSLEVKTTICRLQR